ncbi:UDP-3-O-(3-hydroxymyristoyl)glucosamine N-acyltransferase [Pseudomonas sp. PLB05]|nr:UDP-3-O-(3-hydroxymyristoyl)glucosamine N-acyltransferase [Pseudomonas sp. PLB05]MCD4865816.1 UDP-3-O-(3-hydroxymyristoyl)glucosamine N-acyltransferase [Pseudomonas sp. PLB05]
MMSHTTFTLGELAQWLESRQLTVELRGSSERLVTGLATLPEAGPEQLSFLANPQYRRYLADTQAGAVLLTEKDAYGYAGDALILANPYLAYARLSHLFDRKPRSAAGIHPTALVAADAEVDPTAAIGPYVVIEAQARIGAGVSLGAHCVVGARSVIGADSWLAPRVTLYHDVTIGERAVVQSGAVIGAEGFGFANEGGQWQKIAQLGGVLIGDDVEIGANTTIDRGALANTVISNGVKLDNQIMIAHNVQVGEHTAMAACVGISGSTKIGKHCTIAGGVGMVGHIEVCDHVFVTGMTMVTRSITEPGAYSSGTAMQPAGEWKKSAARIRHLDDMARRLQHLEKIVATVTSRDDAASDA